MFDEELNKIINETTNVAIIKVYNKLIRMEQIKGGIIASRNYLADELKISSQSVCNALRMLKGSGYVTETTFNGQTQFILNHVVSQNSAETVEKIEQQKELKPENNKLKPTVIHKGGKTITRFEIPD